MSAPGSEWQRTGEYIWQRVDVWGNIWQKNASTSRGKIIRGGLQELDRINQFTFPDFCNPLHYIETKLAFKNKPDKWHIGVLTGSTKEIANALLDHYQTNLLSDIPNIKKLHDQIDNILQVEIYNFKESGADSIMIIEDLGETFEPPVSHSLWIDEFRPRLLSLCNYAHSLQMSVILHTAQNSYSIEELTDAGVDCIQLDTPNTFGIDNLQMLQKKKQVTIWSPVDINSTLQTRDETKIRSEARELLDKIWNRTGGFIAGYYWDNNALGLSPKWQEYACDEFILFGNQKRDLR
jgi:hypothetical protein